MGRVVAVTMRPPLVPGTLVWTKKDAALYVRPRNPAALEFVPGQWINTCESVLVIAVDEYKAKWYWYLIVVRNIVGYVFELPDFIDLQHG